MYWGARGEHHEEKNVLVVTNTNEWLLGFESPQISLHGVVNVCFIKHFTQQTMQWQRHY